MLKFVFTDIDDNEIIATNPLSMTLNIDEKTPADDMVAVFSCFECSQLCDLSVYDDNTRVFKGIVDEQHTVINEKGKYLKIVARSMAAKLLDNESIPVSYNQPTSDVIVNNHAKPYGVDQYTGDVLTHLGSQTVPKGVSNWKVLEDFSKSVTGNSPRINQNGEISFCGVKTNDTTVFSNTDNGVPYTSVIQTVKRCEEISDVYVKLTNSSGYNYKITNEDANNRNIQRTRYINTVLDQTPITSADDMIKDGKRKSYIITLESPTRLLNILGNTAIVKGFLAEDIDNMYVCSIRYRLSSNKEQTVITLKRKDV